MADTDVQGMLVRIEATTAQLRQEIARGESAVASTSKKMDASLSRVDDAFDRVGASAESAGGLLKSALAAAVGAVSVSSILKAADSYSQMSDRIGLATKSFGEYSAVQDRLLATANRTYRPLEEAQELYIRTADSLRSMGLSADESMDVMDSFSYLLVTNSASVDKASSAIDAYSKALQTGKIDADGWQSILAAMPTVVDTIAEATGKSAEEIRSLGAQGKLSLDTLTEGLQKSAVANGLLADSMGVAVRDALTALNNAFTVYVGQLNESTDLTGVLASGISLLAENFGTIAEVAGVAAAGALAVYARSLATSAAGSVLATKAAIEDAMARRAQAATVLLAAQADQRKAQTAVFLAEKELAASKTRISGMAVEKQLALQLAEARMAEARATAAVRAAQGAIVGTGRTLLGLLGGPAGIAMLAVGAATAFLTLRDNTDSLEKKLGDLADPVDKLAERFNKLNRATQSVTLRELQANIEEMQGKLSQMSGAMADKFESDLRNMGAAGADGLMAGLIRLPTEAQAALDLVRKASRDQAAGIEVDWKAVADQLRLMPGVTEEMARALESSQQPVTELSSLLQNQKQAFAELTGATDDNTRAERENAAAKATAAGEGQKYLEQLQKQIATSQDKTALQAANRFIAENTLLTDEMVVAIRSAAAAKDAQKAADAAATKAIQDGASAAKEAATQAKNQAKALTDLKAQADIAIKSAEGLAAAYLSGADRTREFALQQKVEEALLRAGVSARDAVTAAIQKQMDAEDNLDISKQAFDLQKEAADQVALAKATLQGAGALEAYNVQKAMQVALVGKNIAAGSKEYDQLLAATRAQQAAVKVAKQAADAGSIMDRLYPEKKLLREYTEGQEALNKAMELAPEKTSEYQEALRLLGLEYEQNKSAASAWGKFTEGAVDRVDDAFANAWKNIGDGFEGFATSLKDGFKQLLAELAHMAITRPIVMQIGAALGVGGLSAQTSGLFGGSAAGGSMSLSSIWNMGSSAYSAITSGFGGAIAAGWNAGQGFLGGMQGAISGGYGYISNAVSSLFSGGAAATGAGNVGFGLGQSLVSGGAGSSGAAVGSSASYATGAGGATALGGALAGIGGALYGYGQSGLKGAATGVAGGVGGYYAGAAIGSLAGPLGTVIGGVIGSALGSFVGGSLFGGDWVTKDQGIQIGVEGGELDAMQFEYQKKKGGLFGKNKKRTRLFALDPEMQDALDNTYDATIFSVETLFERLNVQLNDGVLDALDIDAVKISTKDKTAEEIQQELSVFFGDVAHEAVFAISEATNAGLSGFTYEGLTEFVNNLYGVDDVIKHLNVGLFDMSVQGGFMAEQLSAWAGGFEALKTSAATYYANFFTDAERSADLLIDVRKEFKDLNITLPETRQGYRDMVEALDLTTESGRAMFVTLTTLAGDAAQAYDVLEAQASQAAQKLQDNVGSALASVQRAVNAQKSALTDAYNAQVASLNDMSQTAQKSVSELASVGDSLSRALKSLRGDSDDAVKMLRTQAMATLNSALLTVRAGKSLSGLTGLSDALDVLSQNSTDTYASREDFNRDQGRTANIVSQLEAVNGKQLSTAEKSLESLQARIEQAKESYDLQIAQYDAQLTAAQAQVDALNGVDNSVVSVATAVASLSQAIMAALVASETGAAQQNTYDNNVALIRAVYQSVLGRDLDPTGQAGWAAALANGSVTYANLAEAIAKAGAANGEAVRIPGFASGGLFSGGARVVGERGPELEVTGPSRIYNASQTAAMLGGGQNDETAAEIRELRGELKSALFAIAKHTQKAAKNTDLLPQKLEQELYP
ncbi:tape measure protein [Pseudomonas sp. PNPG3]|uniref:tape measure protein n=1 Tax=Pseudomonas sp. PNPG3 TaxID=2919497 RepID=UPI001FFC4186|nr:tape measure protein [Pseudomonas sp. PNPG3]MCK2124306.1 tape measure protein [Pseudomonas sp. PNPG3]